MLFDAFLLWDWKQLFRSWYLLLLLDTEQTKEDVMLQDRGNWKDSGEEEGAETTAIA